MRRSLTPGCAGALLLLIWPGAAQAQRVAPGLYRAAEGPDLAAHLLIRADGHFQYILATGALDEQAAGIWKRVGDDIALYTEPTPTPPRFTFDGMATEGTAPFALRVRWPNGGGIAGIDFRLGFADGAVVKGYTQEDGWTLASSDHGRPIWVDLLDPIHAIASPRFAIPDGKANLLRVTFLPNDLGTVDFQGARLGFAQGTLILHREQGDMRFIPEEE